MIFCLIAIDSDFIQIEKLQKQNTKIWLKLCLITRKKNFLFSNDNERIHVIFLIKFFLKYCDESQLKQQYVFSRNYFMMKNVEIYAKMFMISFSNKFFTFNVFLLFEILKDFFLFDFDKLILTNVKKLTKNMINKLFFDRTNVFKIIVINL